MSQGITRVVNNITINTGGDFLPLSGGTITGPSSFTVLSAETLISGATNLYDIFLSSQSGSTSGAFLPLSGGQMTGNIQFNSDANLKAIGNTNQIDLDNSNYPFSIVISDDNGALNGQHILIDGNNSELQVHGNYVNIQGNTIRLTPTQTLEGLIGATYTFRAGTVAGGTVTNAGSASTMIISSISSKVNPGVHNSAIIGGQGITADTNNTLFTNNLSANEITGQTIYSGSTNISTIINAYPQAYQTITESSVVIVAGTTTGRFFLTKQQNSSTLTIARIGASAGMGATIININSADYPTVNGLTPRFRLQANICVNNTAPTGNYRFGLAPISMSGASSGGANLITYSAGTFVAGSTVDINAPAAATITTAVGSDFDLPTNGVYGLILSSSTTVAANSWAPTQVLLQVHYV